MNGNGQVRLTRRMGESDKAPYAASVQDGRIAVADWDGLLSRLAAVKDDDSREEILSWMGRSDVPGSPAERYAAVRDTIVNGDKPDEIFATRVSQLQGMVSELGTKVAKAEASGTLPAPKRMGAGSTPEEGMSMSKCIAGGVALLGLIVIPLLLA